MGGPMGGSRPPNYKGQIAQLVSKLDVLTEKPLEVRLNADQRKEVAEQLKGVDADDLSDDAAKEKLDKLLDLVKDQKDTLKAAGYNWPGEGGRGPGGPGGPGGPPGLGGPPGPGGPGGPPGPPQNPFKNDANADHLKKLSERLEKGS
jgi:hypothetical protein